MPSIRATCAAIATLGLLGLAGCSESDARAWNYALNSFNAQYSQPAPTYTPTYTPPPRPVTQQSSGNGDCLGRAPIPGALASCV